MEAPFGSCRWASGAHPPLAFGSRGSFRESGRVLATCSGASGSGRVFQSRSRSGRTVACKRLMVFRLAILSIPTALEICSRALCLLACDTGPAHVGSQVARESDGGTMA